MTWRLRRAEPGDGPADHHDQPRSHEDDADEGEQGEQRQQARQRSRRTVLGGHLDLIPERQEGELSPEADQQRHDSPGRRWPPRGAPAYRQWASLHVPQGDQSGQHDQQRRGDQDRGEQ